MRMRNIYLLIPFLLLACGQQLPSIAAPPGDYVALEKLATAYRQVARDYPVQPRSMRPAGRKEFVQRIFQAAGYDYTASLQALAGQGVNIAKQDYRDLAELLLLPHQGLDDDAKEDLYSADELKAVRTIEAGLR